MSCSDCLFHPGDGRYRFVLISVTDRCNNACDYCYLGCDKKLGRKTISLDTVREIFEKYCVYLQKFPEEECFLTIVWHGGEPLIMGIGFFEKIVELQKSYSEKFNVTFSNGLETNATLLTEEWADFFSKNKFQIGVSLDGPKFVHDIHRRGKGDISSFSRTMDGVSILEKRGIPFSVISVITDKNYFYHKELLDFFLSLKSLRYFDILPGYDPNGHVEYLTPENYGNFLVSLFDYWISKGGSDRISIRYFDDLILKVSGQIRKNTPIGCEIMGRCGEIQYVDEEGKLYPCVALPQTDDLLMGNFKEDGIDGMLVSENYSDFQKKFNDLHIDCKSCNLFPICKGGCAARRFYHPNKAANGKDYFCIARKMIISKVKQYCKEVNEMEEGVNTFVRGPKPEEDGLVEDSE